MFYINQSVIFSECLVTITQLWKNKARIKFDDGGKVIVPIADLQPVDEHGQLALFTIEETPSKPEKQGFSDWEIDCEGEDITPAVKNFVRDEDLWDDEPSLTDEHLEIGDVVACSKDLKIGVVLGVTDDMVRYEHPETGFEFYKYRKDVSKLGNIPGYIPKEKRSILKSRGDLDFRLERQFINEFQSACKIFFVRDEDEIDNTSLTPALDDETVRDEDEIDNPSLTNGETVRDEDEIDNPSLTNGETVRDEDEIDNTSLTPALDDETVRDEDEIDNPSLTSDETVRDEDEIDNPSLTIDEWKRLTDPIEATIGELTDALQLLSTSQIDRLLDLLKEEKMQRSIAAGEPVRGIRKKPPAAPGKKTIERKWIERNGKKYGPYLYERWLEGGKQRSKYLGLAT